MRATSSWWARAAALVSLLGPARGAPAEPARVARIVIDGSINPAVAQYVEEAIARAASDGAAALVIELDTPGGLLQSTKAIVKDILGAPVPVIVYVAPSGATAGSAGVFITMAGHVAAMAPGTSIGAAHPVGSGGADIPGAMGEKVESSTAAFSESIAQQRGRNAQWAARAVRESVSLTAEEAAKQRVVDFVARDFDDLIRQAAARTVDVAGARRSLESLRETGSEGHATATEYPMRASQRVLDVLADPNIAYLLMMIGLLGLYVELTHPGFLLPGVAGGICLVLALTAMQVLPVNYGGLALLVLGVAMLVAEAFLPTFGVLGAGGLVAFVLGSLFLFDGEGEGVEVARGLIWGTATALLLVAMTIGTLVVRAQRQPAKTGREGMIGTRGVARGRLDPDGSVVVRGEYWAATSDVPVAAGQTIEVVAVDGLRLQVRPAPEGRT